MPPFTAGKMRQAILNESTEVLGPQPQDDVDVDNGVKKTAAITSVWSTTSLTIAYIG